MLYTSYFGKVKKLVKQDVALVAICRGIPSWFKGGTYQEVAPGWELIQQAKNCQNLDKWAEQYTEQVLSKLDPAKVASDLEQLGGGKPVVMLCHEKIGEICHRHVLAAWLSEHGYPCQELELNG